MALSAPGSPSRASLKKPGGVFWIAPIFRPNPSTRSRSRARSSYSHRSVPGRSAGVASTTSSQPICLARTKCSSVVFCGRPIATRTLPGIRGAPRWVASAVYLAWEELEAASLQWRDHTKGAVVEGQDAAGVEPASQDDQRGVGQAKLQVTVLAAECARDAELIPIERFDGVGSAGQIVEERELGVDSQPSLDEVVRLRGDESRCDELLALSDEYRAHSLMGGVVGVGGAEHRVGVDDEGQLRLAPHHAPVEVVGIPMERRWPPAAVADAHALERPFRWGADHVPDAFADELCPRLPRLERPATETLDLLLGQVHGRLLHTLHRVPHIRSECFARLRSERGDERRAGPRAAPPPVGARRAASLLGLPFVQPQQLAAERGELGGWLALLDAARV